MAADKDRVIMVLRFKLQLDEPAALELADRAEEIFLSETYRRNVPDKAFWTWVDLAHAIHKDNTGTGDRSVTSIKRGDTTIQYNENDNTFQPAGTILSRIRLWRVARAK